MTTETASSLSRLFRMREFGLFVIILAICAVMSFASPYFLTWTNARAIGRDEPGVDWSVLEAAVWFHDLVNLPKDSPDRARASGLSADAAVAFLRAEGFAADKLAALIEAAGGIMTDWQGRPCHDGGQVLAAANAEIHAEAMALLNA